MNNERRTFSRLTSEEAERIKVRYLGGKYASLEEVARVELITISSLRRVSAEEQWGVMRSMFAAEAAELLSHKALSAFRGTGLGIMRVLESGSALARRQAEEALLANDIPLFESALALAEKLSKVHLVYEKHLSKVTSPVAGGGSPNGLAATVVEGGPARIAPPAGVVPVVSSLGEMFAREWSKNMSGATDAETTTEQPPPS